MTMPRPIACPHCRAKPGHLHAPDCPIVMPSRGGYKITTTPEQEALYQFDAEHNVEPTRETAMRIAMKYGFPATSALVDEISHAVEDAYEIGQKRGILLKAAGLM